MHSRVFQAADIVAKGNKETQEEALQRMGVSPQCGLRVIQVVILSVSRIRSRSSS
jgi:hypothetical protein